MPNVDTLFNVKQYGAKGLGTDDTAAIQTEFNEATLKGGIVFFPRGTYGVSSTINAHGASASQAIACGVLGEGVENIARIKPLVDIGGPVLNLAPTTASPSPSWWFDKVYVDLSLAPTSTGIFVDNVQLLNMDACKFRAGAVGLQIGRVSAGNFTRMNAYNCTTAGYYYDSSSTTDSQGHTWVGCNFFMSTGASANCNAGWLDLSGHQDQTYYSCRVERSAGINFTLPYGWKLDGTGSTVGNAASIGSAASWFVNCVCDAITDGNNPGSGSTGASYWFSEQSNIRMTQCWASALDTTKVWRQPAIYINNGFRFDIANCYISGTGITIAGTDDIIHLRGNHFPNPNVADPCITLGSATLTNLYTANNTKEKAGAAISDNEAARAAAATPAGNVF